MKTLSIGITTFRNRLSDVSKQVRDIRSFDKKIPILLAVNTNYGENMPEDYRLGILKLCYETSFVYPIFFTRYTGLAKMWNTLILHCSTTHIFLMNDDITYANPMATNHLRMHIQNNDMFKVNSTFGTFVISKDIARDMNYFDERLIAYGEEDGDFWTRYEKKYKHPVPNFPLPDVWNRVQNRIKDSYDGAIDCHQDAVGGWKPTVNVEIIKRLPSWPSLKQYPYEEFIEANEPNIGKCSGIIPFSIS